MGRLAEVRDDRKGCRHKPTVQGGHGGGLAQKGPHAIDIVPVGLLKAVKILSSTSTGAVWPLGEIAVHQAIDLTGSQLRRSPDQFAARGGLQIDQVGEAAVHIGTAFADIDIEIVHLSAQQFLLKDGKGSQSAQHCYSKRHHPNADQETPRKGLHGRLRFRYAASLGTRPCHRPP